MAWNDISHDAEWMLEPDVLDTHRDHMARAIRGYRRGDEREGRYWLDRANREWKRLTGSEFGCPTPPTSTQK